MAIVAHHREDAEPMGAQIYSSDPFCPTLASSWNQISISLPCSRSGQRLGLHRLREVFAFISLLGRWVFLRMIGPRLQPRHAKPVQQLADRALGHADRPAGRDLRL